MRPAFHIITVSLVTGVLFFATIAVLVRTWLALRRAPADHPLARSADLGGYAATAIGFILALAAILTGFLLWPLDAVLNSALMKNKILTAVLLVAFWGMFLLVRFRRGPAMWDNPAMAVYAALLAVSGFFFGMLTSSIGGDVAGNPSGFENIVQAFGVETRYTFYLPTWLNIAIIGAGALALVLGVVAHQREPGRREVDATAADG
jgi:hypothetical protein